MLRWFSALFLMVHQLRRREFITLLGGAATWSFAAPAQQPKKPVIGFLGSPSAAEWAQFAAAFGDGLRETGYVDGQNVTIEYRWAEGQYDRLPQLAAELVRQQVGVIFAAGSVAPALAAKGATTTIPIVFVVSLDPVQTGLVGGLARQRTGDWSLETDDWYSSRLCPHQLI